VQQPLFKENLEPRRTVEKQISKSNKRQPAKATGTTYMTKKDCKDWFSGSWHTEMDVGSRSHQHAEACKPLKALSHGKLAGFLCMANLLVDIYSGAAWTSGPVDLASVGRALSRPVTMQLEASQTECPCMVDSPCTGNRSHAPLNQCKRCGEYLNPIVRNT
jgi:hypothetical protein